jgi:hypothetical protein
MTDAVEQGDEAGEAFGGTVTRQKCRLMPAPSRLDAGTASQLIPGVRRTYGGARNGDGDRLA